MNEDFLWGNSLIYDIYIFLHAVTTINHVESFGDYACVTGNLQSSQPVTGHAADKRPCQAVNGIKIASQVE